MKDIKLAAPCLFGTESLVASDLRSMGFEEIETRNGRVLFMSDINGIIRSNICSRFCERIEILIGEFDALSFERLYEATKALPWEDWIDSDDAFPVTGWSINSKLHSIPDCQKIVKKAVVDRLRDVYGISWFEEQGSLKRINFSILKDKVSLMIDTSGVGLHKRGYRKNSNTAPIKETLAASLCALARLKDYHTLYDPFCGSGTILIEGTMLANNIMPGFRRTFACEKWVELDEKLWRDERSRALDLIKKDSDFSAVGSDISADCVELSIANAKKAGVFSKITVNQADIKDFKKVTQCGTLICNPPYGERMLDRKRAAEIYKTMGERFTDSKGWSFNIISPDEEFEAKYGTKARKKRKLYNGMIKCNYYSYF